MLMAKRHNYCDDGNLDRSNHFVHINILFIAVYFECWKRANKDFQICKEVAEVEFIWVHRVLMECCHAIDGMLYEVTWENEVPNVLCIRGNNFLTVCSRTCHMDYSVHILPLMRHILRNNFRSMIFPRLGCVQICTCSHHVLLDNSVLPVAFLNLLAWLVLSHKRGICKG